MPELRDLPNDIYSLLSSDTHHEASEALLDKFTNNLKGVLRSRLAKRPEPTSPLRFSALGTPNRKAWYDAHPDGTKEELRGPTLVKFLYGDVIEALILYLAEEAGHSVAHEQEEVSVDGVLGHIDAIVDGVLVDVKSASSFGYKKFEQGTVEQDDLFGYVAQLSGYAQVLTPTQDAAWIAVDKVSGDICVSTLSKNTIAHYPPDERIKELKEVISHEQPPERCYPDVEDGKSGNRKLATGCSYCHHKFRCWPDLRGFVYSSGPRYLTTVAREPDVPEIRN